MWSWWFLGLLLAMAISQTLFLVTLTDGGILGQVVCRILLDLSLCFSLLDWGLYSPLGMWVYTLCWRIRMFYEVGYCKPTDAPQGMCKLHGIYPSTYWMSSLDSYEKHATRFCYLSYIWTFPRFNTQINTIVPPTYMVQGGLSAVTNDPKISVTSQNQITVLTHAIDKPRTSG